VALVKTDDWDECISSIIRVERMGKSQKTAFFILTAVKASNLAYH
jgi:hypothetical protein